MRKSVFEAAWVVLAASVLAVVMTYPVAFRIGSAGRIDSGDGQWSIWVVNWVARTLVADPLHVFDANIFYPHRGTLAYSETNLVTGALAVPAYWATKNPYLAHNVVLLLSFVLAAAGAYYLARYLTRSRPAAAVAAVLFGFCPYVFAHTAHIHLMMTAGLPFSLLAFHRLADRPGAGRAAALGAMLALTGLSCGYYGIYAALLVSLASVYDFLVRRRWRDWRYVAAVAAAAAIAGLLLFPFTKQYADLGAGNRPVRELKDQFVYSATWSSYLASSGLLHRWMLPYLPEWRDVVFPGFAAIVLAGVGGWAALRRRRGNAGPVRRAEPVAGDAPSLRETAGFYSLAAAFTFWLSFGPKAGLYPIVYAAFPFFSLMRAPARLGVLVALALAVLATIGVAHVTARRRRPWLWASALALVALVETTPVPLYVRTVPPISPIYDTLAVLPRGGLVELPFFWRSRDWSRHTLYMRFSIRHWQPLVNGYSDYFPPDFVENAPLIHSFPSPQALDAMRRSSARYLLIHLGMYDAQGRAIINAGLEQLRDELRPLASVGDDRLFELTSWQENAQSAGISSQTPR